MYVGPLGMLDLMYFKGILLLEKTHNLMADFIAEFSTVLIILFELNWALVTLWLSVSDWSRHQVTIYSDIM